MAEGVSHISHCLSSFTVLEVELDGGLKKHTETKLKDQTLLWFTKFCFLCKLWNECRKYIVTTTCHLSTGTRRQTSSLYCFWFTMADTWATKMKLSVSVRQDCLSLSFYLKGPLECLGEHSGNTSAGACVRIKSPRGLFCLEIQQMLQFHLTVLLFRFKIRKKSFRLFKTHGLSHAGS